jgi:hypothetical protein
MCSLRRAATGQVWSWQADVLLVFYQTTSRLNFPDGWVVLNSGLVWGHEGSFLHQTVLWVNTQSVQQNMSNLALVGDGRWRFWYR